jgi:hypothetical protein
MTLRDDGERTRSRTGPATSWPIWAGIALALAWAPPGFGQDVSQPAPLERVTPHVLTTDMERLARRAPARVWREGMAVRVIEDLRESDGRAKGGDEAAGGGSAPGGTGATVQERRAPGTTTRDARSMPPVKRWEPGAPVRVIEDLRESGAAPPAVAAPIAGVDFDGIPATGALPPDTVGDVGPNHYVQMVNTAFAIYDKSGTLLAGPVAINTLWADFGGPCETQNNGDPIVRYDHLADRWLMSQFALPSGNFRQCFAISRGPNPVSDGWYLYDFPMVDAGGSPVFPDYPKIGVWPDGYYMGTQRGFPGGGLDVWTFERQQMLSGAPAAAIHFAVTAPSLFLMPSDLDGPPPPAGTPNFFLRQIDGDRFGGADRLEVFAFSANWTTPASSTFTLAATLPTAPFDSVLCSATLLGACVPQPGTPLRLETLTVWPMWRAQYRNFGTHESLVTNHTVDANGNDLAGIRWYELRRPPAGSWSILQQGTHSPDATHRWMGSLAMDSRGQLALGYGVSSGTVSPGIRAATRLTSDPPGTLGPEFPLVNGSGSQTHGSSRWGNYSSMDVDPVDDCTFWYTTEYYATTSAAGWKTRVSSFRLPSCGPAVAKREFQYAAKLVCGIQKDPEDMRLARGFYATTVNIHNPHHEAVAFNKKLALTYPPVEQRPGKVIPIGEDRLQDDEALKVDCMDIRRKLFPNGFPTPYIEGFVVVQSHHSLDVTGVYTTATLDREGRVTDHSSIDVESVPERVLGAEKPDGGCPDLVVRDIGRPSVSCPGGGGTCVTTVQVTIANVGTAAAGPFKVRVALDPSVVVVESVAGGLAAGATQTVPIVTPPGGNCFDPDCTICVTVDSDDQVEECDESNNKLCETTPG